jgi:drug/metabolite transporter (DMT)-like permease
MQNASQTVPILLNLLAAVIGAIGQWLYKKGGTLIGEIPWHKNWYLFSGMILFCGVMVLFVIAFKMGGRLSVVYPVYATTFIWGTMIAVGWDGEPWAWGQLVGLLLVVVGVSMVAALAPAG